MLDWTTAVKAAIRRQVELASDVIFTRKQLVADQLDRIVAEVGSVGQTPSQTLSRELQELSEVGFINFVDNNGTYRFIGESEDQRVSRYDIDGFRSLRGFSISLKHGLNALVGPNGAGKTNFIDFLDFLSNLILRDASSAVSTSGGVSRVFSQEDSKRISPKITARVCGTADLSKYVNEKFGRNYFRFEYSVEIRFSKTHSSIYISSEKIKFFSLFSKDEHWISNRFIGAIHLKRRSPLDEIDPKVTTSTKLLTVARRNPLRYFRRNSGSLLPRLQRPDVDFVVASPPAPDESLLALRPLRPAIEAIRLAVSRGRAFNLNPMNAREPDELTRSPLIRPDGSGLSATLYHLQQLKKNAPTRYRVLASEPDIGSLDNIVEWTKLVLPELQDISVVADPHTGQYLAFLIVGEGERNLKIPLQSVSDGTLKWLALTAHILAKNTSYSLEEPENFLHPRMQQFLISLMRDGVEEQGVSSFYILSTHSETIINQLKADELILFEFRNGSTSCRRLADPQSVEKEINKTGFGLGYYYAANAIS